MIMDCLHRPHRGQALPPQLTGLSEEKVIECGSWLACDEDDPMQLAICD